MNIKIEYQNTANKNITIKMSHLFYLSVILLRNIVYQALWSFYRFVCCYLFSNVWHLWLRRNYFWAGCDGEIKKPYFIMQHETLIITSPLEIVPIVARSLTLLLHRSDISAICNFWPQLQILKESIDPLDLDFPSPCICLFCGWCIFSK